MRCSRKNSAEIIRRFRTDKSSNTKRVLKKFVKLMLDIEKKKSVIIKENQELASLRDWLLPLLMNGQVTFKK